MIGLSAQSGTSGSKETLKEVCCELFGTPGCELACVSCGGALPVGSWALHVCCISWCENAHRPMAHWLPLCVQIG